MNYTNERANLKKKQSNASDTLLEEEEMINLTLNNYGQDLTMDKVDEKKSAIPNIVITTQGKLSKLVKFI
jgi:hypothetical protein